MVKMETITKKAMEQEAINLAEHNERGRLLLSETKISGYLISTGKRLTGMNAEKSAKIIINEIAKDPRHYEYEPGHLHLYESA